MGSKQPFILGIFILYYLYTCLYVCVILNIDKPHRIIDLSVRIIFHFLLEFPYLRSEIHSVKKYSHNSALVNRLYNLLHAWLIYFKVNFWQIKDLGDGWVFWDKKLGSLEILAYCRNQIYWLPSALISLLGWRSSVDLKIMYVLYTRPSTNIRVSTLSFH